MTQNKLTDEQVREVLAKKDVGYAILFEEVHKVSMSYLSGVQRSFWKIALRDLAETTLKNEDVEDELEICKKALSNQSKAIVDKVLKGGAPCQNPTNRMPKTVKLVEFINKLEAEIEEKNEYVRTNLPDKPFKIILAENARYKAALECIEDIAANVGFNRTRINCKVHPPIIKSDKDMDLIYEFAHVAVGRCKADHHDWQKRLDEYYKALDEGAGRE